jgi:hypothetical protein
MKKSILILSLVWLTTFLFAQTIEFVGVVKDSLSKETISYASIIAINEQDSAIAGTISDEKGRFKIHIPISQAVTFKISFLGYQPSIKSIKNSEKKRVDLGTLFLIPETKMLTPLEVTGTAARVERKFDKTVYLIDETTTAASLTIYDLLRTLPGVTVEEDNTIIFKGVSPAIYVDNTPSQLLYPNLLAIPVDRVEKVELIDASMRRGGTGNGGIINIKLKKITDDGLSGVLSTKPATISFKNVDESAHLVNLNYKKNNNIFVSNTNLNTKMDQYGYTLKKIYFNNPIVSDSLVSNHYSNSINSHYTFSECIGYLYQPSDVTKFTFSISGSYDRDQDSSFTEFTQINNFTANKINSYYSNSNYSSINPSCSFGVNLWHQIDTNDQYLEANIYYAIYGEKTSSIYSQNVQYLHSIFIDSLTPYKSFSQNINPQSIYFDFFYNKPLKKSSRFNIFYCFDNQFHQQSQLRVYENDILNLLKNKDDQYFEINQTLSFRLGTEYKKWKWDIGVNFEDQYINGSYKRFDDSCHDSTRLINKNYFKFLPSFVIGYLINDEQELKLSGSVTCDYMYFDRLQDFVYKDNFVWFSGNSELKPPKKYSLYFGYSLSKEKWNSAINLFYSYSDNYNRPIVFQISDVITLNKTYNIAELHKMGTNISLWFKIKKFSLSLFSSLYFQKFNINKYKAIALDYNMPFTSPDGFNFNYYMYANMSYRVKKITVQSTLFYFGKQYNESGSSNGYVNFSISLNCRFLQDKLQLGIGAQNLLRDLFINEKEGNNLGVLSISETFGYAYQPSIFISARYDLNFGSRDTEYISGKK